MKILHLASGAGDMYCGSCLLENALAAALRAAGEDVLLVPVYTPIRTEDESAATDHVVYGGVNVFLQQTSALFRHTPRFVDRLFDRPQLLEFVGRLGSSTRPKTLGALTVSMLRGEDGRQAKELEKLLEWLERDVRPDVVHLSNVLLAGMARQIVRRLGVPVVATLSGEDSFLDNLPEPHRAEAMATLRDRCRDLTALVATNRYYAGYMANYLRFDRSRIHVIRAGLNLAGCARRRPGGEEGRPLMIGFLSRICREKGLDLLAEAFIQLRTNEQVPAARLMAAGYMAAADRPYLDEVTARLRTAGLEEHFHYAGELDRAAKISFLQSLDIFCLPSTVPESKGLPLIEAWANGVPAVVAGHGALAELVADTHGGLVAAPGDVESLAENLERFLTDRELAELCGRRGYEAVHERFRAEDMAREVAALYRRLVSEQ